MDGLEQLRREVKRKKEGTVASGAAPAKRWRRRGDVEAERERKYLEDQQRRRGIVVPGAEEGGTAAGQVAAEVERPESEDEPPLAGSEVVKRLRDVGEPVTLFGETNWARYRRLRDIRVRLDGEQPKGQRNIFQKKLRDMEAKDAEIDPYIQERDRRRVASANIPVTVPVAQPQIKPDELPPPKSDEEYVYREIQKLLARWTEELERRPLEEKKRQKGKAETAKIEQTKEYLKPLEKLLKKNKLDPGILRALKKMFEFVAQREYVKASDVYLQLAIGNAPWPMGATMVGIHARSAREKIGEGKIAHVMNDEQTRKYIQAVKRLVTMAQEWLPTVPSKMISS